MSRIYEATRRASDRAAAWETGGVQPAESIGTFPVERRTDTIGTFPVERRAEVRSAPHPKPAATVERAVPVSVSIAPRPSGPDQCDPAAAGAGKLISAETLTPAFGEYRRLAATLVQADTDRQGLTLMVTSAVPGEGKTLTAANLALTLSRSFGRRVLLVDADMRRPFLHTLFGAPNRSGLDACLRAGRLIAEATIAVDDKLTLLTAGTPEVDPVGLLSGAPIENFVREAMAQFECVVFDTPPAVLLPDAELLSKVVTTTLLVIHSGKTPTRLAERAVAAIGRERIAGVVLNQVSPEHLPPDSYADARTYGQYA